MTIEEFKTKTVGFISLGCDKNRVDLEEMMSLIDKFGLKQANVENANVVIVNTCAFILSARRFVNLVLPVDVMYCVSAIA